MPDPTDVRPWHVLVLFGASGTGKSTAARRIARDADASWLQVDDLRLALQYSRVTLPERTDRLYWFETTREFWLRPVDDVLQAFIDVATVMVPAVRVVIDSHVVTDVPLVIEGDGILPSLVEDPILRPWVEAGTVRFCCVAAERVDELAENMMERGRGDHLNDRDHVALHAQANLAFNEWLVSTSQSLGIPVVPSRPFESLTERIRQAITSGPMPGERPTRPVT